MPGEPRLLRLRAGEALRVDLAPPVERRELRVVDAAGRPLAGASVGAVGAASGELVRRDARGFRRVALAAPHAATDADGVVHLEFAGAAARTLRVTAPGHVPVELQLADAARPALLSLDPEPASTPAAAVTAEPQ
ncbi:MAG: carboxypeptidase regulatory-like domain-containing protein [Planctomycetes bacterium]|nr:carboxypeptidase regulatory-like domain-containing protein [Planctomycetota bacterium]